MVNKYKSESAYNISRRTDGISISPAPLGRRGTKMPFQQLLKSPYQYFKNRNGIFHEFRLNLRWEQWSNILIWQLFENLPKIKYFLAYMLTGQLVQRLRLFHWSKTIFVRLLPLSDEPSEWLFYGHWYHNSDTSICINDLFHCYKLNSDTSIYINDLFHCYKLILP